MNRMLLLVTCLSVVPMSAISWAEKPEKGERQRPPQEAFTACEGQEVGAVVSFTTPRGDTLSASCESRNDQLVAVPEGHKGKAQRRSKQSEQ